MTSEAWKHPQRQYTRREGPPTHTQKVKNCRRTPKQGLQNVANAMGWVIQMSWQYQRQCRLSPCSLDLKSLPIRTALHVTKCSGVWGSVCVCVSHSVMSDSLWPYGLWPTRLLCPWNSPSKNTGVGSVPFSRGSSLPRDRTWVSSIAGRFFTVWATCNPGILFRLPVLQQIGSLAHTPECRFHHSQLIVLFSSWSSQLKKPSG